MHREGRGYLQGAGLPAGDVTCRVMNDSTEPTLKALSFLINVKKKKQTDDDDAINVFSSPVSCLTHF